MKKCKPNKHVWNMGGDCIICGMPRGLSPSTIKSLDDDDIPVTSQDKHPRGFWGNQSTGYITDKENQ